MKKHILLLFILLITYISSFSQEQKVQNLRMHDNKQLHFGFTIGLNTSDFYIRNSDVFFDTAFIKEVYSIENKQQPGFHLGPISNLRLGKYFDLRFLIGLTFSQRDLQYTVLREDLNGDTYFDTHIMPISSTFLEFPLLLKYKSKRINNYRVYIIGGINAKMDLAAKKKIPAERMPMIRLSQPDLYGEFGMGIDFYLPYFKLSPELKMGVGMNNVIVDDNTEYSGAVKYMKSKIFMLSFHFSG